MDPHLAGYLKLLSHHDPSLEYRLFQIPMVARGKPRMTGSDAWKKRPAVLRYREWKDELRELTEGLFEGFDLAKAVEVSWVATLPVPRSLSRKRKALRYGRYHREKPDRDNIDKALLDCLFPDDKGIASGQLFKRWCHAGEDPRIILQIGIQP